jgi:hypothetical protein
VPVRPRRRPRPEQLDRLGASIHAISMATAPGRCVVLPDRWSSTTGDRQSTGPCPVIGLTMGYRSQLGSCRRQLTHRAPRNAASARPVPRPGRPCHAHPDPHIGGTRPVHRGGTGWGIARSGVQPEPGGMRQRSAPQRHRRRIAIAGDRAVLRLRCDSDGHGWVLSSGPHFGSPGGPSGHKWHRSSRSTLRISGPRLREGVPGRQGPGSTPNSRRRG